MAKRFFRQVLDFLLFSNLFVAVPITCLTSSSLSLFGPVEGEDDYLLFIYTATFLLYGIHRLWGLDRIPEQEYSPRHRWARKNSIAFYLLLFLAAQPIWLFAWSVGWRLVWPLIPAIIIAGGYTVPIVPTASGWIRLRDIPLSKVFFIGLTVAYLTAAAPFIIAGQAQDAPYLAAVERFFFIIAITIPFDIRDMRFDQRSGLLTLPVWLGVKKAQYLALVALGFAAALAIVQLLLNHISMPVTGALLGSYLIAAVMVNRSNPNRSEYFFSLGLEGTMIIQWILVSIALALL